MMSVMPFVIQASLAHEQADHEAATTHLHQVFQDEKVVELLRSIGCGNAVKRQKSRFVGLSRVILALMNAHQASDFNVKLLFGDEQYVRDQWPIRASSLLIRRPGSWLQIVHRT
jgi:hypothetical protein